MAGTAEFNLGTVPHYRTHKYLQSFGPKVVLVGHTCRKMIVSTSAMPITIELQSEAKNNHYSILLFVSLLSSKHVHEFPHHIGIFVYIALVMYC